MYNAKLVITLEFGYSLTFISPSTLVNTKRTIFYE